MSQLLLYLFVFSTPTTLDKKNHLVSPCVTTTNSSKAEVAMATDFVEVTSEVTYDDLPSLNVEKVKLAGEYDPCVEKIYARLF
jgi:hypothetical protein